MLKAIVSYASTSNISFSPVATFPLFWSPHQHRHRTSTSSYGRTERWIQACAFRPHQACSTVAQIRTLNSTPLQSSLHILTFKRPLLSESSPDIRLNPVLGPFRPRHLSSNLWAPRGLVYLPVTRRATSPAPNLYAHPAFDSGIQTDVVNSICALVLSKSRF